MATGIGNPALRQLAGCNPTPRIHHPRELLARLSWQLKDPRKLLSEELTRADAGESQHFKVPLRNTQRGASHDFELRERLVRTIVQELYLSASSLDENSCARSHDCRNSLRLGD